MCLAGCTGGRITSVEPLRLGPDMPAIRLVPAEDAPAVSAELGKHDENVRRDAALAMAWLRRTLAADLGDALRAEGFHVLTESEAAGGLGAVTLTYSCKAVELRVWEITRMEPAPPPQSPNDFSFPRQVRVGEGYGGVRRVAWDIRFADSAGQPLGALEAASATADNWDTELHEMAQEVAEFTREAVTAKTARW